MPFQSGVGSGLVAGSCRSRLPVAGGGAEGEEPVPLVLEPAVGCVEPPVGWLVGAALEHRRCRRTRVDRLTALLERLDLALQPEAEAVAVWAPAVVAAGPIRAARRMPATSARDATRVDVRACVAAIPHGIGPLPSRA
jgi:hypothetical protein